MATSLAAEVTLNVEHDTGRKPFELLDLESPKFGIEAAPVRAASFGT